MNVTAELMGRVGHIPTGRPPNEHGLTLTIKVLPARGQGAQTVTACDLTADTLAVTTQQGNVYAIHLSRQRYVRLDALPAACTQAAFMTRLSRRLFVGCADGSIQCYDVSTSSHLSQLPGHRTAIVSLSTKPDTEQLLSASADAVLLWDMATFRQRRMLGAAPYGSSLAAFSPGGNLLAAAATSGPITLWRTQDLRELATLHVPKGLQQQRFTLSSISISQDEQWLLAACSAPALLLLYSLQSMELQIGLKLPSDMFGVTQVKVLPDSTSAAVLSGDGRISLVDFQAASLIGQLQLTFPGCRAISVSMDPRANSMAVVCSDGLVRLYDMAVIRGRQQGQPAQLERLHEAELQLLSTDAESLHLKGQQQSGSHAPRRPSPSKTQVLSDVGNLRQQRPAAAHKAAAKVQKPPTASRNKALGSEQLRVRQLGSNAGALNRRKLRELLLAYGEFPGRYRRLIWEQLLQLPRNSAAFSMLQDQGLHPAYKDLVQQMHKHAGCSSSVAVRLTGCLSQLAHWCALFGEVGFLPDFAFPFVKLFGPKAEPAFEAVVTLLLNWCKGWFELFPNPPLPLLRRFLLLVSHHDLELGSHLQQLGVPVLERVWQHMSCGMSDVLPHADDWLVLWDHCLAADAGPAFYYAVLAAYLMSRRHHLLKATGHKELACVLDARPPMNVRKLVKHAQLLHEATPDYVRLGLRHLSPICAAESYPVFSEYPTGSVETQQQERQRIQEAEEALIRRRQVVAELQQRSKQVAYETAALTSQRQQLTALDAQRRAALRAIEESLASATARLDDKAKEQKLKQIRLTEEAYQASLASLRAEWSAELTALKSDVEHKRRQAAAMLKARQEEEEIKALEFQAQQRLWALQQEELAAAGSSVLRDAAATQASALSAQLQRKAAEWQAEDEARSLEQQHVLARKSRLAAAAEQEAAVQAAKGILLAQELQAQQELAKVEHQRRLRQLAESEARLTAEQLQLQADKQAVAAAAGREAIQQQAQAEVVRLNQHAEGRAAAVAAEYDSLQQQLTQLHMSAAELGSSARLSAAQQQLTQLEATLAAMDEEHAARVKGILAKLQDRQHPSLPSLLRRQQAQEATGTGGAGHVDADEQRQQAAAAATAAAESAVDDVAQSIEAAEQRLAAIRQRRAALEDLYGLQLDAEVQKRLAAGHRQQQAQQALDDHGQDPSDTARHFPLSLATSHAPAGSSSSSSKVATASPATSLDVSAELEHLLAEAEVEVQRELDAARSHLQGSALTPHSSTAPAVQQQQPSWQSGTGQGRAVHISGAVGQVSHATSTPSQVATGSRSTAVLHFNTGTSNSRLKTVLEELPGAAQQAAHDYTARDGAPGPGGVPRPADSSSSSSSSPKRGGGQGGSEPSAGSAGGSGSMSEAGRGASSSSHTAARTSAALAHGTATAQVAGAAGGSRRRDGSQASLQVEHRPSATAAVAVLLGPALASPSSTLSARSMASPSAATSRPAGVGEQSGHITYRPVLLDAPGASRASADTERFLSALSDGQNAPSYSGDTSSSSVSKPGSVTFDVSGAAADHGGGPGGVTPTLVTRTLARTGTGTAQHTAGSTQTTSDPAAGSLVGDLHHQSGGGEDEGVDQPTVTRLTARHLEPSGRVSAELRRSSSATSEELEQLLQQLSQYEEHLLEEVAAAGGVSSGQEMRQQQQGGVDASLDSSLSWSRTLAGLAHLLPPDTSS